ncbi:MAG: hypothetical protein ACYC3Q_08680 [Gemmatimonadaceae bacterium]
MEIDAELLAQARVVLGTLTDTDTVNVALANVGLEDRLVASFEALAAAGGLVDIWGEESEPPARPSRRARRVAEQPDG